MKRRTIITTKITNPTPAQLQDWVSKNSQWDVCWFRKSLEWGTTDDTYLFQVQKRKKDKASILNWIKRFEPTHFISINAPTAYRTEDYAGSLEFVRMSMKNFEGHLCGDHWIHHYIPFIGFAENHKGHSTWHFHLFLNQGKYSDDDVIRALKNMCEERRLGQLKIQGEESVNSLNRSFVVSVLKIDYHNFEDELFYYALKRQDLKVLMLLDGHLAHLQLSSL